MNKNISIIGAGLSGCTVGILLKRAGYNVTIYDYGRRPDLVVGESLIPALIPIIQKLGLEEEVKTYAQLKPGATIYLGQDIEWNMSFKNFKTDSYAYNVPRNSFDASFKNLAIREGCEIRKEKVGAELLSAKDFVIDASGRKRILANALEISSNQGKRKDVALFAHFDKAEIKYPGNLHMNVDKTGWYWRIPLKDRISIGVVSPAEVLEGYGRNSETQFDNIIQEIIGKHIIGAKRITEVMKYQNYQLVNEKLIGENWACVGDAAGFADPVFSSGVYLALSGAVKLAESIIQNKLSEYEQYVKSELMNWREVIEAFYDHRFLSMIKHGTTVEESKFIEVRSLVTQVMSGYADRKALDMFFGILNYCHANVTKN